MNSEAWKIRLQSAIYIDNASIIELRYVILHILAQWAAAYRQAQAGTLNGLRILQYHKRLENVQLSIKEKSRGAVACGEEYFTEAKHAALNCIEGFAGLATFVTAA